MKWLTRGILLLAFVIFFTPTRASAETPPTACKLIPGGFIECTVPAAQLPFMTPLTPDCHIIAQDEKSVTVRCSSNEVVEPKLVPSPQAQPKPKAQVKPTKKVKKKAKKKKKKKAKRRAR